MVSRLISASKHTLWHSKIKIFYKPWVFFSKTLKIVRSQTWPLALPCIPCVLLSQFSNVVMSPHRSHQVAATLRKWLCAYRQLCCPGEISNMGRFAAKDADAAPVHSASSTNGSAVAERFLKETDMGVSDAVPMDVLWHVLFVWVVV